MNSHWMTVKEAAEYARISIHTLRRWIAEGLIKPVVTRNKRDVKGPGASGFIIDVRDLDKILEGLKQDLSGGIHARANKETGRTNLHW